MKLKRKICYLFVFDGFSDWEASYATVGIRKSNDYVVKTIAMSREPVRSMGGMTVVPDLDFIPEVDLQDIDATNTGMVILPGGRAWEEKRNGQITPLVAHCMLHGIPVAAICGATVFLADLGLLNRAAHTSNHVSYLESFSPAYRGLSLYRHSPSVKTDLLITARGTAAIEFAQDIFETLGIQDQERVAEWFQYFERELA